MPRVLYCARTCPPLEPPFPSTPAGQKKPAAAPFMPTTATQKQVDLDDPEFPTSPLPDHNHQVYYEYESDGDGECPPSPESFSIDSEDYTYGNAGFSPYLRNCPEYPNIALEHYNSQKKNEIKYQLIKAIISCVIRYDGSYQHVNFTAKSSLENSKEDFFFAELRYCHDTHAWVPVSIVSMEEHERVGGFSEMRCGGVDPRHCFGCGDVVKHPVDGSLYEAGHYLVDDYFFRRYIEVLPAT